MFVNPEAVGVVDVLGLEQVGNCSLQNFGIGAAGANITQVARLKLAAFVFVEHSRFKFYFVAVFQGRFVRQVCTARNSALVHARGKPPQEKRGCCTEWHKKRAGIAIYVRAVAAIIGLFAVGIVVAKHPIHNCFVVVKLVLTRQLTRINAPIYLVKRISIGRIGRLKIAYREQPDYRRYRSDVDGNTRTLFVPLGAAAAFFLGRFSSRMDERGITGGANLTHKAALKNGNEIEFKAGMFYEDKSREFKSRNLGYVRTSRTNPEILRGTITNLFQPQNINNTNGLRIDEQTNSSDSYDASNNLLAFYGSVNVPLSKKVNVIAGVRYEANTQKLNSAELNGTPVRVSYPVNKLLPSLNMTYNFSEKSLVRAAYGRTLNRPEFRELAPFAFYDFDYNIVYKGNPEVRTANIDNFDLRYEWYPTPNELVSIAGFYKNFTDPIEIIVVPGAGSGGAKTFTFANAKSSVSSGLELEIRKNLSTLGASPLLGKMSLLFNAAFIFSRIKLGTLGLGQSDDRPLQGQSPYIVNVGLNYNDPKSNLQVNVLYNVIGKRIFAAGFDGYPDIYEMPRNVLDITFSKELGSRWIVKGGVTDIFNQTNVLLQDGNGDKKYDRVKDQLIQTFRPGRTLQLGFSYRIL